MATIVFCDDLEHIRKLIWVAMKSTPHRVELAKDGEEGLAMIQRVRPDLIVTDVVMPRMGGIALSASVRADPSLRHIPVVFMTASLQPDDIARLPALGARAHIAKPFSPLELRAVVDRFVSPVTAV